MTWIQGGEVTFHHWVPVRRHYTTVMLIQKLTEDGAKDNNGTYLLNGASGECINTQELGHCQAFIRQHSQSTK